MKEIDRELAEAVSEGDLDQVRSLLSSGADPNRVWEHEPTLFWAAQGELPLTIIGALLDAGANPDAEIEATGGLWQEEVGALLEATGSSKTSETERPRKDLVKTTTPIHQAAYFRNVELIQLLLKAGANPDTRDRFGHTVLMIAAESGYTETVAALLAGKADPDCRRSRAEADHDGEPESVDEELFRMMQEEIDVEQDWTALMFAARGGHLDVVRALVDIGANLEARGQMVETAIGLARVEGHTKIIQLLRDAGAKEDPE